MLEKGCHEKVQRKAFRGKKSSEIGRETALEIILNIIEHIVTV